MFEIDFKRGTHLCILGEHVSLSSMAPHTENTFSLKILFQRQPATPVQQVLRHTSKKWKLSLAAESSR